MKGFVAALQGYTGGNHDFLPILERYRHVVPSIF